MHFCLVALLCAALFSTPTIAAAPTTPSIVIPATATGSGVDLDRLAVAVARHETCGCTCGTGKSRNNCFGIGGVGNFITYETKEESFKAFKVLWEKRYGGVPDLRDATTWVCGSRHPLGEDCGGGSPRSWLSNVLAVYGAD